jgi:hypothetical protein
MRHIDRRLREITAQANTPFGGISILTVGDFYQLPPVKAEYIFEPKNRYRFFDPPDPNGALHPLHVWSSFSIRKLETNQRQRGGQQHKRACMQVLHGIKLSTLM